jgi:hypothetical protein
MNTQKRWSILSYFVVLIAFGVMFSCEQLTPMEEPILVLEESQDFTGIDLEQDDDLISGRLVYTSDCNSECIKPGSGNYFATKDSKSQSLGVNTKMVSYKAYNTEDKFVVKVKYEVTSGPSKAKASILIQINGKSKEFKVVPSGYTATFSIPLEKGWAKCNEVPFSIIQKGLGAPILFSEAYKLIPVCKSDKGLLLWNKLGSLEEVTNSEVGANLFPGSGMVFKLGKYGNGLYIPQYKGVRSVHSPYSPREVIPLWSFSIEFWFKRTHDDEWDGHSFIQGAYENNGKGIVDLTGHSGYVGMWGIYTSILDNNGKFVGRYNFDLKNKANWEAFYPKNEWIHLAISHDANWPLGKRIKIFRNGVELTDLKVEFETGNMDHVGQFGVNGFRIGNFIAWDRWGAGGVLDNIKIWDYPKTDFADRFHESNY